MSTWQYRRFDLDDAFIGYRYAANLAHGRGWVFNPGEHMSGATSPLHILFVTGLSAATGSPSQAAHLLGGVCLALSAWFVYLLFRRSGSPEAGLAAGLVIATSPLLGMTFGMETMLYVCLASASLYWYRRGALNAAGVALGLLVLTRPDGVLLALVLGGDYLVRHRRVPWAMAGVAALVTVPWFAYSTHAFGSPLPNTFGAKLAQAASGDWTDFLHGILDLTGEFLTQNGWYLVLIPAAIFGMVALARDARDLLVVPIWGILYFASYSALRVPNYHWYYGPLVLAGVVVAAGWPLLVPRRVWGLLPPAAAISFAAGLLVLRTAPTQLELPLAAMLSACLGAAVLVAASRRFGRPALVAAVAALFVPLLVSQVNVNQSRIPGLPSGRHTVYRDIGSWLNRNAAPSAVVAGIEIGTVGYYADRPVLDYLGLLTPEAQPKVAQGDYGWWLRERQPDYIIMRSEATRFERAAPRDPFFGRHYRLLRSFERPNWSEMLLYGHTGKVEACRISPPLPRRAQALGRRAHITTCGLYDPTDSVWYLRNENSGGIADITLRYGELNSRRLPLVGDWDGDGVSTVALYDQRTSQFDSSAFSFQFRPATPGPLLPIAGDWDGDGVDTVGLYDPATRRFHLRNANTSRPAVADVSFAFRAGSAACVPLAGDWDGDGADTVGLYDGDRGRFYLRHENASAPSRPDTELGYGSAAHGLVPIVGDWEGDGKDSIGLYDQVKGRFHLRSKLSAPESSTAFGYGPSGLALIPVMGDWTGARKPPASTAPDSPAAGRP